MLWEQHLVGKPDVRPHFFIAQEKKYTAVGMDGSLRPCATALRCRAPVSSFRNFSYRFEYTNGTYQPSMFCANREKYLFS